MKIMMIHGNPYHPNYGGVHIHTKYLNKYLSKDRDIKLIQLTFGEKNTKSRIDGNTIIALKRIKFAVLLFPFQILIDIYRLHKNVKQFCPDIIHIQSTIPTFSLLALRISKKTPTIITLHGYLQEEYKIHTGLKKLFYRFFCAPIERKALSTVPHIITVSPKLKKIIAKNTDSQIFVVPNGVDLSHIEKIEPRNKDFEFDYPTVFFLGILTKGKGISDLIRAVSIVKEDISNIRLLIGGTGPYESTLKKEVENHGLNDNVIFLGFLDENKKFLYMKSIDIFVLPSYWESFPLVLLEALACGKPIVTTNVGGNTIAVKDGMNGFLIEPGDVLALFDKLFELLTDKKLKISMGKESYKRAKDFDWSIITEDTKLIYQKIHDDARKKVTTN